ncbi:hypothetical protein ISS30_00020 [bacterium]|nr:hypothetical protein [FCB group bacterium]MBL7190054.1 hypothetical protein [bacterium]
MVRNREDFAKKILEIDNEKIVDIIYENSNNLVNIELERHRRIVDKGRDYLGMTLIILGIIVGIGNIVFSKYSIGSLSNLSLIPILVFLFYIASITLFVVSLFAYYKISFIHEYLWTDFEDTVFIPDVEENVTYYYKCSQLVNTWYRIELFRQLNEKLVFRLNKASLLSLGGIVSIIISLILVLCGLIFSGV